MILPAPTDSAEPEADDTHAAMRSALAAARAEVQSARSGPVPGSKPTAEVKRKKSTQTAPSASAKKTAQKPIKVTRESLAKAAKEKATKPEPARPHPRSDEVLAKLDPETRSRIKALRRLNPGQSDEELLQRIRDEGPGHASSKPKKGWFSFG